MFLVDKYSSFNTPTINNIIDTCYKSNKITLDMLNLSNDELLKKFNEFENNLCYDNNFNENDFYDLNNTYINTLNEFLVNQLDN